MSEKAARSGAGLRCGVPKVRGFRLSEGDGPDVCDNVIWGEGDKSSTAAVLCCGEAGGTIGDVSFLLEMRRCGEQGGGTDLFEPHLGESGASLLGSAKSEAKCESAMLEVGKTGICASAALYLAT